MSGYESIIVVALAAASTAVTTYAAVQASEAQADEAEIIRKQKANEAQTAAESAAFEEQQSRRRTSLLLGQQRAAIAASGLETTSGTPLIQEIDLTKQAELEALSIRRAGRVTSGGLEFESRIARYRRDVARGAVPYQIAGGVLSAAASGYSAYTRTTPRRTTSFLQDWSHREPY